MWRDLSKSECYSKHGPWTSCQLSPVSGKMGGRCQNKNQLMVKHTHSVWLTSLLCSSASLIREAEC